MSHLPDDEPFDVMEVEILASLPPDKIETQPHERLDISQHIRQQNADNKRVGLDLGQSSGVKPRKRRSKVWENFDSYQDKNGMVRATCKGCGKDFDGSSKLGTTHLRNHFTSCQRMRNGGGGGDNLAGNLSDTIAIKEKSVMDQPLDHLDVARMIIKIGYASLIDSTNKRYIIELYKEEKGKLRDYFKKRLCRFCLTITYFREDGYSCLMVWFIDDDWKLKNKILKLFDFDKTNDVNAIENALQEWGIENNLSSMVVDFPFNALYEGDDRFSNQGSLLFNNKLLCSKTFLRGFQWWLCFHLLESLIRLVKNENFRNAPTIKELMKLMSGGQYGHLICVLKNVLGLKEAGFELANIDPHFKILTKEKWDVLRATYDYYEEWDFLQQYCYKYNTANTYFPLLCSIHKWSKELRKCHDVLHNDFTDNAWCEYNLVLAVASVLDPRFKMDIVENWYKEIFGDQWKKEFDNFNHSFIDIYNGYAREINNIKSCTAGSEETNSSISYKMLDALGKPCKSSDEPNHVQLIKSDLGRYLKEDKFPPFEDFDILEWWRVRARHFPTLARMARDFLSIRIGSPPSFVSDDEKRYLEELEDAEVSDDEIYCTEESGIKEAYICTKSWLAA